MFSPKFDITIERVVKSATNTNNKNERGIITLI